jgi:ATP-citrate lyase beta-subunit
MPEAEKVLAFIEALYGVYVDGHFTYLEFNPITVVDGAVIPLDTVAKLDDTAAFQCAELWGKIEFPKPFGSTATPEEAYIASLDEKTGASLKLTVLNPDGRVWPMVAGGGASVIYADTVVDLGYAGELACYGEYSGNPSTEMTYEYAKTLLDLMTRVPDPQGREKFLLIGGGIANFTDVAKTFTGIVAALRAAKDKLQKNRVRIYVRRGGPNYVEGLENMRRVGEEIGVPVEVYGPETHMTRIVSMALSGGET